MNIPIISIFMPVYNGSAYLRKTLESILDQTFKEFELVCVDDSSTDGSLDILDEYSKKDSKIIILRKEHGGNVPKSWNFVMPYLRGAFIMYISQDDLMSADNLELLYKRQLETGADCVLPDMIWYYEGTENKTGFFGVNGDRDIVLSGKDAFLLSLYTKIHGFMLCKAEIYKSEKFDEDIFNSDEYIARKNFLISKKVAFCRGRLFYRQDNPNSITKRIDPYIFNYLLTEERLLKLLLENGFKDEIVNEFKNYMFWSLRGGCLKWMKFRANLNHVQNEMIYELLKDQFSKMDKKTVLSHKQTNLKRKLFVIISTLNFTSFLLSNKLYKFFEDVKRVHQNH